MLFSRSSMSFSVDLSCVYWSYFAVFFFFNKMRRRNRRKEELGRFGCVGIASFIRKAAKLPKIGLR